MSTTAVSESATAIPCPSDAELDGLLEGHLSSVQLHELTEHVGSCAGCQQKLDTLATGEVAILLDSVRDIDKHEPPKDSKLWNSIDKVLFEATRTINVSEVRKSYTAAAEDDDELGFLTPTSKPGRLGLFGEFEIVRLIGRGGMGVVLHAFDPDLQRDVALKVLSPELSSNKTARQRFCREARAAAAVTHDNIVAVYQVNEDAASGLPYLVMQLVNGESLEQRLRRVGKLSILQAVKMAAQASSALAAAHNTGLIHRDVKPGNMLLEADDRIKLTDFGLARAQEDMKLTRTGYVSGTPLYMSPEQARGDDVDARADLFSLGVVLYEALAGKPPFEGKTPLAVLRRVADDQHQRLSKVNPRVPDWLEDIVDALLSKEPKDRIASAEVLTNVLQQHLHNTQNTLCDQVDEPPCHMSSGKLHSNVAKRRYRRRVVLMVALPFIAGFVMGAGIMAIGLTPQKQPPVEPIDIAARKSNFVVPTLDTPKMEFASDSGAVWSTDTGPDGKTLAVGLEDGKVKLFDMEGHLIKMFSEHTGPIWSVDFHTDSKRMVSASDDGTVKVWHTDLAKSQRTYPQGSGVRSVAFAPKPGPKGETIIALGERSGLVEIVDIDKDEQLFTFNHGATVMCVAFSQSDKLTLATAGTDKIVRVWDVVSKTQLFELVGHNGPVFSVAFSPNGKYIATGGWDKIIRIFDAKNGVKLRELVGNEYDVWSVAFDNCEGYLCSAGQDGTVRVWNPDSGEEVQRILAHKPVAHVARFSTDGKTIISGGRDGAVRMWDVNFNTPVER